MDSKQGKRETNRRGEIMLKAVFSRFGEEIELTDELWQYDFGQKIQVTGIELPDVCEVHFQYDNLTETKTVTGYKQEDALIIDIPNEALTSRGIIKLYIYLVSSEEGRTVNVAIMHVNRRMKPEGFEVPEDIDLFHHTLLAAGEYMQQAKNAKENSETAADRAESARDLAEKAADKAESAKNAAESASGSAQASADEAKTSKENAETAVKNAEAFKTETETARSEAVRAATESTDAKDSAEKSRAAAEKAKQDAEAAKAAADADKEAAETARSEAETAKNDAVQAKEAAEKAKIGTAADRETAETASKAARISATSAEESAKKAETAKEEIQESADQIQKNATEIDSLKEKLTELGNKTLHEEYADLLHGKEPKENWYINASNGTGRTLLQFFSYIDIDVSEYIGKKLYPYTSHKGTNVYHSSRSVVFYDESGTFISGTGISSNNPINGIEVPEKSKTVSVCFNYDSDDNQPIKPQVYYLAINRENKNKLMLKKDVLIDYEQIQNKPIIPTKMSELENDIVIDNVNDNVNDVQTIRKPTISFIFDDGLPSTSDLVSLFDSYGWKCGFAILANSNLPNIKDNFLSYQSKGYEILSHSTDGVAMQDDSLTIDDVETKMKKSKEILINNGFNITGWVTPSTWLNNKYFDNLCKYYEYGFGHLDTNQVVNHHVFWGNDIRQLERWSLQSKTLEQTKTEIDSTINECGYLCFYAHAYPSTVHDNFTIENMKIIMDYIKKYIDNGKVQVLTPRCAINDYYTVRHSDLLDLYKKVIN